MPAAKTKILAETFTRRHYLRVALNIKYRPLKAFVQAVETQSFTHAASRPGATRPSSPALSNGLAFGLEVQLFERTTREHPGNLHGMCAHHL